MLSRPNRLKKKRDFERVYKLGIGKRDRFLALKVLENDLNTSRIGFVVSKKISKKAVVRNLIKRRLREAARSFIPELKPGLDIVVFALKGTEGLDFWKIKDNLKNLFQRSNLL